MWASMEDRPPRFYIEGDRRTVTKEFVERSIYKTANGNVSMFTTEGYSPGALTPNMTSVVSCMVTPQQASFLSRTLSH